jgi:branched-chain amino acid aminotransferase
MEWYRNPRLRESEKRRAVWIRSDIHPDGEYVPELKAFISRFDSGFGVGYNTYEYARTYNHHPFQLKAHMDRFWQSLKVLRLDPHMSKDELIEKCEEVTLRNVEADPDLGEHEEYNIIWVVTPGEYSGHGRSPPPPPGMGNPTIIINNDINDMKSEAWAYMVGCHVVTPSGRHAIPDNWDPKVKTFSRLPFVIAQQEAKLVDPKAIAIMLDQNGNLSETIGHNIFVVMDDVIMTPKDTNILRGVTRANVIALAKRANIPVVEKELQKWHLYNCDEAFLSTTALDLTCINRFNGVLIGDAIPGPVTRRIFREYSAFVAQDVTGMTYVTTEERELLDSANSKLNEERKRQ